MKPKVGMIGRILRIALGLGLMADSVLGYIGPWGWIGLLPLATGIFRFCPAYWRLGPDHLRQQHGQRKALRPPMGAL